MTAEALPPRVGPSPRASNERAREPALASVARAVVHAITAAVFAFPLALAGGVWAAAFGAAAGAALGRRLATTRARLWVLVAAACVLLGLALLGAAGLAGSAALAASLGPAAALGLAETFAFGTGAFAVSTALRAASARRPLFGGLEVAAVALSFAQLVVAHRHGAINRPFAIADPILARGDDPTSAIVWIGVLAAAVVALHLLAERSLLRAALHLALAAALLGGVAAAVDPPVPDANELLRAGDGGRKPDRDARGGQNGGGGGEQDSAGQRSAEDLDFRDQYEQPQHRTPVAVVLFHDEYSPPTGTYYFRQTAFSRFNGRRLVVSNERGVDEDVAEAFPVGADTLAGAPPGDPYRVPVETTVALLADHPRPFGLEAPVALEPAPNPNPSRFRRLYGVRSLALDARVDELVGQQGGAAAWSEAERDHYTAVPDDPRYRELADRIVETLLPEALRDDPAARAFAITHWLGERGTYSLRSEHAGADDPTAHFLFGDLTGYCVHFAHAGVYLMRAAGVPARVAAGYAVPEANRRGGSALVLTGSDAHAWPEIHLDGVGWVVADVAVQNVLDPMPPPPDPDLQRLLGELVRGQEPLPVDGAPPTPLSAMAREALVALARALAWLAFAGLALLGGVKAWRRVAPAFAPPGALPRLTYRAMLDRLADVSLVRGFGESRESFARRLAEVAPSLGPLTDAHLAARFGAAPLGAARFGAGTAADARALAARARSELRAHVPWWRRALGALVPWTWLRVR